VQCEDIPADYLALDRHSHIVAGSPQAAVRRLGEGTQTELAESQLNQQPRAKLGLRFKQKSSSLMKESAVSALGGLRKEGRNEL